VGDEVVVVDPATFATSTSRLVAMKVSQRECGTMIHPAGQLCVTTDHPIFDPDARGFFPAGDWLVGTRSALLISDDRGVRREAIRSVEIFTRVDDVFDLTVEHEWHTFVAEGVVVHNKEPPCNDPEPNTPCSCGDQRVGVLACLGAWGPPECTECRLPRGSDGGVDGGRDGGRDGGIDDGGVDDGGIDGGDGG
jgi:hypothetical protein